MSKSHGDIRRCLLAGGGSLASCLLVEVPSLECLQILMEVNALYLQSTVIPCNDEVCSSGSGIKSSCVHGYVAMADSSMAA